MLQKVARKVWSEEKDSALLHELESVLDTKTFKDIVEPLWPQRRPSTGDAPLVGLGQPETAGARPYPAQEERGTMPEFDLINGGGGEGDDNAEAVPDEGRGGAGEGAEPVQSEEELIGATIHREAPVILDGTGAAERTANGKTNAWGNIDEEAPNHCWHHLSFDEELRAGESAVSVHGSRAQMLVRLQEEVEEEEEQALRKEMGSSGLFPAGAAGAPSRAPGTDNGPSSPATEGFEEDVEDEWDDDLDSGFISVRIDEDEMLKRETENIELRHKKNAYGGGGRDVDRVIKPSFVWRRAREGGNPCTHFSYEKYGSDEEDEEDAAAKALRVGSSSAGGDDDDDSGAGGFYADADGRGGGGSSIVGGGSGNLDDMSDSSNEGDAHDGASLISEDETDADLKDAQSPTYDSFTLRIVHERHRTGFEADKDLVVREGMLIAGRYRAKAMLGEAAFSTAWSCFDELKGRGVCLKIIKNSKEFMDQSLDEIKLLRYVNAAATADGGDVDTHHVLRLFDYFYHKEHLFIVTELLRDNLYEFSRYNRESGDDLYFTMGRLRAIARQMLEALRYIHSLGLVHCDLKPENVLIKSYSRCQVKVIDFGSSCYLTDHLSTYIQSRSYRAPEVLLGCQYDQKIDVWSVGCIIAELWTGQVLFYNHSIASLLARIVGIIGPFPASMLAEGKNVPKYFTASHGLYESSADIEDSSSDEEDEEDGEAPATGRNGKPKRRAKPEEGGDDDPGYFLLYPKNTSLKHRLRASNVPSFLNLVEGLLQIDPKKRLSTRQALEHEFFRGSS